MADAIYTDFSGLTELRQKARSDSGKALQDVSRQFESLFLQMMIKSMRSSVLKDTGVMGSQQDMYTDLYDKQLAIEMSSKGGIGLADMMRRQLSKGGPEAENQISQAAALLSSPQLPDAARIRPTRIMTRIMDSASANGEANSGSVAGKTGNGITNNQDAPTQGVSPMAKAEGNASEDIFKKPKDFLAAVWETASNVADKYGLNPKALLAQAALETGWGKHIIRRQDGSNSNNLFGIKADHKWEGDKVVANTLEYRDGVVRRENAAFRAYDSMESSMEDYAQFISNGPRYQKVMENPNDAEAYVKSLQDSGYATDPQYADKIINIMNGKPFQEFFSGFQI